MLIQNIRIFKPVNTLLLLNVSTSLKGTHDYIFICKYDNIQKKKCDIFSYFAQNIDLAILVRTALAAMITQNLCFIVMILSFRTNRSGQTV